MSFWSLAQHVCQQVAPVWPLARSIAVNPWWQQRQRSMQGVAASEYCLDGTSLLMPARYYRQHWQQQIQPHHLAQAAQQLHAELSVAELLAALAEPCAVVPLMSYAQLLDEDASATGVALPWQTEIVQQVSQFCALWVNYPEQFQGNPSRDGFYQAWLTTARQDRGIRTLMGEGRIQRLLQQLPDKAVTLWQWMERDCGLTETSAVSNWLHLLLRDVYGWASVFAHQRWQTSDAEQVVMDELTQLLSVRMAWEWVCWRLSTPAQQRKFQAQWQQLAQRQQRVRQWQHPLWVWQRALELSYQEPLAHQLRQQPASTTTGAQQLQAVFCIDVRSEPMRRALEAQHPAVQTLGFAGFFGLPIRHHLSDGLQQPQLPGLVTPRYDVQQAEQALSHQQRTRRWRDASWHRASESSAGAYGWVEMSGLAKIWKLLQRSFWPQLGQRLGSEVLTDSVWHMHADGKALSVEQMAELAANALQGMGLTQAFAKTILIVGHSACVTNNPHAASLDCGACGGQSGEVNARVLAQLFNDKAVRHVLAATYRIQIPPQSTFYAALHDTTQQQLRCVGAATVPEQVQHWLSAASQQAQLEQLERLPERPAQVSDLTRRAADWAELRPEWGLAKNAALVFAPRAQTRGCNFAGRVFLHDYQSAVDPEGEQLQQLLSAPMVVAHWINMQYYASMVAPRRYGSGNKLLHNVVADGIGVFEGNGGDLRIGLAKQSIHDGRQWYHQPLRLTVVIAATTETIDSALKQVPMVAELVANEWLHLWQWEPAQQHIQRWTRSGWQELEPAVALGDACRLNAVTGMEFADGLG